MPHPHPDWEVTQLVKAQLDNFRAWLDNTPGATPCGKFIEAEHRMNDIYNVIQNSEQYWDPQHTDPMFPESECEDCPDPK